MLRKLLSTPYALLHASRVTISSKITNLCTVEKNTMSAPANVATYDEVKKVGLENKEVLIIDVREPKELQETGVIPGSINIPLGDIQSVLRDLSPEQFTQKYGRNKPSINSEIIFSCKSGKRAASALAISEQLGFKCVKNFSGGWLEWEEKSKC
ncbi:unnamed protein product [Phaedon cochleariae]|uniref:Rhodanese domain-containing protein n=1 Tax=Phaedon cochleariae TaxID=80249 RepID=A0A9P0DM06_PHACE|nr:unnamed protein product [Phaedon cochleariae]